MYINELYKNICLHSKKIQKMIQSDENNPLLQNLLHRADSMMHDINRDGESFFRPYGYNLNEEFGETPVGGLLPEELRQFLLKKYKKLTKKQENKRGGINIGTTYTHKPAFIILRRDFKEALTSSIIINDKQENNLMYSPQITSTTNIKTIKTMNINNPSSPHWFSSDTEHQKNIQINIPPNSGKLSAINSQNMSTNINYSPHNKHKTVHTSPSLFSLSAPNNLSDSADPSPSPRLTTAQKEKYQILSKHVNTNTSSTRSISSCSTQQYATNINNIIMNTSATSYTTSSGNDSATSNQTHQNNLSLSIVDENKADQNESEKEENMMNDEIKIDMMNKTEDIDTNQCERNTKERNHGVTNLTPTTTEEKKYDLGIHLSDSSVLMDNVINHSIVFGNNDNDKQHKHKSNSYLFSEYLKKHDDFGWLRQLDLFSFVDGVVLHKLDTINDNGNDDDNEYQDDSLLSVLPKLDGWINAWCKITRNVIPIVRNNRDMLTTVKCINKYNVLSSAKYVEECMQIKGSRLQRYFYYDPKERGLNELKLIAERFKWDNKNLIRWFEKHFNRLWYHIKDFPNAHDALLYQSLFYEYYLNGNTDDGSMKLRIKNRQAIVSTIILNLSHFYYQISNKVDLYQGIVDKSAGWGQFAGAVSGLGSLSLMSVIHPLVGIAAVPLSIHLGSSLGANSGAKVGDAIAYSKAHYVDGTERYDLGKIDLDNDNNNDDDDIIYHGCYDSDHNKNDKDKKDDDDSKTN